MKKVNLKDTITLTTTVLLLIIGLNHAFRGSGFMWDVLISLIGFFIFCKLYDKTHQNITSLTVLSIFLFLHNIGWYDKVIFVLPWDKWLHLLGGFTIALILHRFFIKEKWSRGKRFFVLILATMGVGALHEIIEWIGYAVWGAGEGFLFYGIGDEGEWQNSITDMIFNLIGVLIVSLSNFTRKLK